MIGIYLCHLAFVMLPDCRGNRKCILVVLEKKEPDYTFGPSQPRFGDVDLNRRSTRWLDVEAPTFASRAGPDFMAMITTESGP